MNKTQAREALNNLDNLSVATVITSSKGLMSKAQAKWHSSICLELWSSCSYHVVGLRGSKEVTEDMKPACLGSHPTPPAADLLDFCASTSSFVTAGIVTVLASELLSVK